MRSTLRTRIRAVRRKGLVTGSPEAYLFALVCVGIAATTGFAFSYFIDDVTLSIAFYPPYSSQRCSVEFRLALLPFCWACQWSGGPIASCSATIRLCRPSSSIVGFSLLRLRSASGWPSSCAAVAETRNNRQRSCPRPMQMSLFNSQAHSPKQIACVSGLVCFGKKVRRRIRTPPTVLR